VLENISHWKVYVCAQLCFQVWEGNAVKTWALYNILLIISKGENCDIKILELSFSWILKCCFFHVQVLLHGVSHQLMLPHKTERTSPGFEARIEKSLQVFLTAQLIST
jgi:hypothetical protein